MAAVCLLISPVFGARGPSGTFNVRDFGAVGDGKTMDTKAVRAASAALREAGGGTLLFPGESGVGDQAHNGYSYLTGGVLYAHANRSCTAHVSRASRQRST